MGKGGTTLFGVGETIRWVEARGKPEKKREGNQNRTQRRENYSRPLLVLNRLNFGPIMKCKQRSEGVDRPGCSHWSREDERPRKKKDCGTGAIEQEAKRQFWIDSGGGVTV